MEPDHTPENGMLQHEIVEEELRSLLSGITIERELREHIEKRLERVGMYFRIFARVKAAGSLCAKLIRKEEKYKKNDEKLQDLIGIRVVLYYADDVPICQKMIGSLFHVREEDCSIDTPGIDEFKPVRLNLICDIPDGAEGYIERMPKELWQNYRIDKTFEVQIRTIFSEGWHEVNHDIRYKHEKEWESPAYYEYNRKLNGINATLEVCDNTIISVLDSLAYQCYKECKLSETFRYRLRIHMQNEELRPELRQLFETDKELWKKVYRLERSELLYALSDTAFASIPRTLNHIIYIGNALQIGDERIDEMTPSLIKRCVAEWQEQQDYEII